MDKDFEWAVRTTLAKIGPPPVIGSFMPTPGDIGFDEVSGTLKMWDGFAWYPWSYP